MIVAALDGVGRIVLVESLVAALVAAFCYGLGAVMQAIAVRGVVASRCPGSRLGRLAG